MPTLEFERKRLNYAAKVREAHNLDCIVCPFLKVKGGRHDIVIRCHHPALSIPIRLRKVLIKVPKWCPRRKVLEGELVDWPCDDS
jgi:hypothetical protein